MFKNIKNAPMWNKNFFEDLDSTMLLKSISLKKFVVYWRMQIYQNIYLPYRIRQGLQANNG